MTTTSRTRAAAYPQLPEAVWHGWFSQFRDWVEPTTDGALEGVFAVASAALGICVGRTAYAHLGRPVYVNNYYLLVGPSGTPRKTTVVTRLKTVLRDMLTPEAFRTAVSIGSGEGLLELFCEEDVEGEGKHAKRGLVPVPGRRGLLDEPEFMNLLKKARRPGTANLVEILLGLYDGLDFSPRTRTRPITVVEPFFSLITTTTFEALEVGLQSEDIDTGLLPRFAPFACTPRDPLPWPPAPDEQQRLDLAHRLRTIMLHAKDIERYGPLALAPGSRDLWADAFTKLHLEMRRVGTSEAALLARVPQHIVKWAILYALDAGHTAIEVDDLSRAVLVGGYLSEMAGALPGSVLKTPVARIENKIIEALGKVTPRGLTAGQVHQLVSGRVKADTLRRSLESLAQLGVVEEVAGEVRGRRVMVYSLPDSPGGLDARSL